MLRMPTQSYKLTFGRKRAIAYKVAFLAALQLKKCYTRKMQGHVAQWIEH